MEILIVGVVIVALMVYTSTKIKRSAAQAFEREEIETGDFKIVKPGGFINPIKENSPFAFEAYTKDFGKNDASDFRQAHAYLRIISGKDFKTVCKDAKTSADVILSESKSKEQKIYLLESEKSEKGVKIFSSWKIVAGERKIYELKVSVLETFQADYADAIGEMIESFTVK